MQSKHWNMLHKLNEFGYCCKQYSVVVQTVSQQNAYFFKVKTKCIALLNATQVQLACIWSMSVAQVD